MILVGAGTDDGIEVAVVTVVEVKVELTLESADLRALTLALDVVFDSAQAPANRSKHNAVLASLKLVLFISPPFCSKQVTLLV